ncbi:hypothetical protein CIHG_02890 [Coccidioides immitis H538.4]|uniref:Uncharacterized protein n=2 Tax=Coccidioides immitis TaxID=5501 RepID=A0A0J8UCV7_COCIT|nr:hypothetical protein CIRG_07602 [Coccidioides immitis RMSCC 2394]KMU85108.1 hypothetical protein CIHG_02890 [Coccidioides immitis H538.4]
MSARSIPSFLQGSDRRRTWGRSSLDRMKTGYDPYTLVSSELDAQLPPLLHPVGGFHSNYSLGNLAPQQYDLKINPMEVPYGLGAPKERCTRMVRIYAQNSCERTHRSSLDLKWVHGIVHARLSFLPAEEYNKSAQKIQSQALLFVSRSYACNSGEAVPQSRTSSNTKNDASNG